MTVLGGADFDLALIAGLAVIIANSQRRVGLRIAFTAACVANAIPQIGRQGGVGVIVNGERRRSAVLIHLLPPGEISTYFIFGIVFLPHE